MATDSHWTAALQSETTREMMPVIIAALRCQDSIADAFDACSASRMAGTEGRVGRDAAAKCGKAGNIISSGGEPGLEGWARYCEASDKSAVTLEEGDGSFSRLSLSQSNAQSG